jgi:hypothetical protein
MLLPQKSHAIQNLPGSGAGRVEALSQICVFALEFFDAFGVELRATRSRIDRFHSRFGLERPAPEARELVTQMPDEPLELLECFYVRTF